MMAARFGPTIMVNRLRDPRPESGFDRREGCHRVSRQASTPRVQSPALKTCPKITCERWWAQQPEGHDLWCNHFCQGYPDDRSETRSNGDGEVDAVARETDSTGLEALNRTSHPVRDAAGFRTIRAAMADVRAAENALREAVRAARAEGDSWTVIGAALGTSRQAAHERFGKPQ